MEQCSICLESLDGGVVALAKPRRVEGAKQKANGKWVNHQILPGREFDSLNEYRAAKKQRAARRAAWSAQAY